MRYTVLRMRSPAAASRILLVGCAAVIVAWVSQLTLMTFTAAAWWFIGIITRWLFREPPTGAPGRGISGVLIAMGSAMVDWTSTQVCGMHGSVVSLLFTPPVAIAVMLTLALALGLSMTAGTRGALLLEVPTRVERIAIRRILSLSSLAMPLLWGTYYAIILVPGVLERVNRRLIAFGQGGAFTGSRDADLFSRLMIGAPVVLCFMAAILLMASTHAFVVRAALRNGARCGRCGYAFAKRSERCSECGAPVSTSQRKTQQSVRWGIWALRATSIHWWVYLLVFAFHMGLVFATGLCAYAATW